MKLPTSPATFLTVAQGMKECSPVARSYSEIFSFAVTPHFFCRLLHARFYPIGATAPCRPCLVKTLKIPPEQSKYYWPTRFSHAAGNNDVSDAKQTSDCRWEIDEVVFAVQ